MLLSVQQVRVRASLTSLTFFSCVPLIFDCTFHFRLTHRSLTIGLNNGFVSPKGETGRTVTLAGPTLLATLIEPSTRLISFLSIPFDSICSGGLCHKTQVTFSASRMSDQGKCSIKSPYSVKIVEFNLDKDNDW